MLHSFERMGMANDCYFKQNCFVLILNFPHNVSLIMISNLLYSKQSLE